MAAFSPLSKYIAVTALTDKYRRAHLSPIIDPLGIRSVDIHAAVAHLMAEIMMPKRVV